jgi:hypothetical protein
MKPRNVNSTNPDEAAEVPQQTYGPRNEEERIVYELVKEALESGEGKEYASVAELMRDLDELDLQRQANGKVYGPRNAEENRIFELVNEALEGEFKEYDTVEELLDDVLGKVDPPGK